MNGCLDSVSVRQASTCDSHLFTINIKAMNIFTYLFPRNEDRVVPKKRRPLISVEIACLCYMLITAGIALFNFELFPKAKYMLINRGEILLGMAFFYILDRRIRSKFTWMLRVLFQLFLLSYWYSETYEFHYLFDNLDHYFAQVEETIFGGQPAIYLSQIFDHWWISEILYFAYFIYFALFVGVILYYALSDYRNADRIAFVVISSFFAYYLTYIFLPVAGPQFYFPVIGWETAAAGEFPEVGKYFTTHPELAPGPGYPEGIFYRLVGMSQQMGERPTAAFPSSHVGITTIVMIFFYFSKGGRALFHALLPIYICLCIATVYIQAHYAIDLIAGIISGFALWGSTNWIYNKVFYVPKQV